MSGQIQYLKHSEFDRGRQRRSTSAYFTIHLKAFTICLDKFIIGIQKNRVTSINMYIKKMKMMCSCFSILSVSLLVVDSIEL